MTRKFDWLSSYGLALPLMEWHALGHVGTWNSFGHYEYPGTAWLLAQGLGGEREGKRYKRNTIWGELKGDFSHLVSSCLNIFKIMAQSKSNEPKNNSFWLNQNHFETFQWKKKRLAEFRVQSQNISVIEKAGPTKICVKSLGQRETYPRNLRQYYHAVITEMTKNVL